MADEHLPHNMDELIARAVADQERRRKGGRHHRPSDYVAGGTDFNVFDPSDTRGEFTIPSSGSSEGIPTTQGDGSNTIVY
jgi:hypothetical protein